MLYHSPVAQVIIIDPDSGQEWKWTSPDLPYLTGCTINYERGRVSVFTVSLDITYEVGIKLMSLPSPFKQGNIVKARIGYATGGWTPWASGFLQQGGAGLSLDANGLSGQITIQNAAISAQYKADKVGIREADGDLVRILENCARFMGLELNISVDADTAILGDKKQYANGLLDLNSLDIVKKICTDWNLEWWTGTAVGTEDGGRKLFVTTPGELSKKVDQDTVVRTYMVRGVIDDANNLYPCLSWSPEGSEFASWLVGTTQDPAGHGVDAADIDVDTGEVYEISVEPSQQDVATVGFLSGDPPRDEWFDELTNDVEKADGTQGEYMSFPVDPADKPKAEAQVKNRQLQGNQAQKGVITSIGVPDERVGNHCRLLAAGAIFDDLYMVDKMTHTYAPGSWDMSLTVHREGTKAKTGDQQETQQGQM